MFSNILQYSQENTCVGVPFKESCRFEARKSIKRRLQHRCFPVNIAKFLRTAFSIEQLLWLLLELKHFFSPATLVSIHIRFLLNTFKGEGTSCGKLNVIASLIWFPFFQIAISFLAYDPTFSGQLYFGRSYFFTFFQSNYFDTTVTFLGTAASSK